MPFIVIGLLVVATCIDEDSDNYRAEAEKYKRKREEYYSYYRQESDRLDREYEEYMDRYYNGY